VTRAVSALVLTAALLGVGPSQARADDWTARDTAAQAVVGLSLAADYLQTRQIVRDCRESNPMIGDCGENMSPALYFAAVFGVSTLVYKLPRPYREIVQVAIVAVQVSSVRHNWQHGYTIRF
jgi:hypothetical protein